MFRSRARGGKAYAAEQKVREFKKRFFCNKQLHKTTSTKPFDLKKLICKTVENMKSARSQKHGYAPDTIEKKTAESEKFTYIYKFYRLAKVKQHAGRYERADIIVQETATSFYPIFNKRFDHLETLLTICRPKKFCQLCHCVGL